MTCTCLHNRVDPLCLVHRPQDGYGRVREYKDLSNSLTEPTIPAIELKVKTVPLPTILERLQYKRMRRDELIIQLQNLSKEIEHLERMFVDKP